MLIVWIAIDYRRQKQRLRELEASGVTQALRPQRGGHPMSEPITAASDDAPPHAARSGPG